MISVIMLTYNREHYVKNMIEDILKQTYKNLEFVIIDNGSADASGIIAERYAERDERIQVVHLKEPHSIGYARNVGVKVSKGQYISFVDDDDRVTEDFLEFLYSLLNEYGADISMCGISEGDGITRVPQCLFNEKIVLTGEEAVRLLLGRKYIRAGLPTKMYKREILERHPFVENYKNEDIHMQYKYLLEGQKVVIHGLDKYYATRHSNNVSGFTSNAGGWNRDTMRDYLQAFRNRTEYIKEKAPNIYRLALYSEWSYMISMIEKIDRFHLSECREIGSTMSAVLTEHKQEFLEMPELKDFEREWIERYIS